MLPAGTILTYQAKGRAGFFTTEGDIAQALNTGLAQANMAMRDYHLSSTSIAGAVDAYLGGPFDFTWTATVQTSADFANIYDIQSILDGILSDNTSGTVSSSIPNITLPVGAPSIRDVVAQGSLPAATTSAGITGQPGQGGLSSSNPFSDFLQSGVNSFALLAAGAIVAVVLIVGGKSRGVL